MTFENEYLELRASAIHGTGAFAKKHIPAGTRIIEYVGRLIDKAESARQCSLENAYIFSLNDQFDIDGNVEWNPARLINHSCHPNCEAIQEGDRIWVYALRDVRAGEEVSYNYGYDLESYRDNPCRCGAPDCVGYIVAEEFFPHVRKAAALTREAMQECEFTPAVSSR
ncbi:MAG: SET domain-containing protein-lysine N-methyltransferase [Verrucomicrobiota bacterium]